MLSLEFLKTPMIHGIHPDGWGRSRLVYFRPGPPVWFMCIKRDWPGKRSDGEPIYYWHPYIDPAVTV